VEVEVQLRTFLKSKVCQICFIYQPLGNSPQLPLNRWLEGGGSVSGLGVLKKQKSLGLAGKRTTTPQSSCPTINKLSTVLKRMMLTV
jgi:hypothetical protein